MRFLRSASEIQAAFVELVQHYKHISLAVAWASEGFDGYDCFLKHADRLRRAIIGIHFFQTDPDFIERFLSDDRVVFIPQPNGVFHPKIYLFESSAADYMCLLGSANFTRGGFSLNMEACVLFGAQDDPDGSMKAGIDAVFERYWPIGKRFTVDELNDYRALHQRAREKLKPIAGEFDGKKPGRSVLEIPALMMTWDKFFSAVQTDKHQSLDGRIATLEEARRLFVEYGQFSQMPKVDRQRIAGFGGREGIDWRWFGSMVGAGHFKNRVNDNDVNLSQALDAIPPSAEILKKHYLQFVESFIKAFPSGRGHGLATASRLLALKRPDYFVCFDRANRDGLCKEFEITLNRHDYEKYWDSVVERILLSRWWNSPRPKAEKEMKVWDGRTAFLDSLYYVPQKPARSWAG
jgi:hypothetical protein